MLHSHALQFWPSPTSFNRLSTISKTSTVRSLLHQHNRSRSSVLETAEDTCGLLTPAPSHSNPSTSQVPPISSPLPSPYHIQRALSPYPPRDIACESATKSSIAPGFEANTGDSCPTRLAVSLPHSDPIWLQDTLSNAASRKVDAYDGRESLIH